MRPTPAIRPVLIENCYECHSADAEKIKGGLLLDSKAGWMAGGDSGPAIPVTLEIEVTAVGTLDLFCVATTDQRKWKLEFNVREQ